MKTVMLALAAGACGDDDTAEAIAPVEQAMDLAQGNVNPQLVLADLLRSLRLLRPAGVRA